MTKPLRTWWHELNTWEPEVALAFYHRTLGWEFDHMLLPDGDSYWIAHQGGRPVGGIYALRQPDYQGIPSHWMTYLAVADIGQAERAAVFAGGEVCRPTVSVPGVGKLSIVSDSTGAIIGLIEPEASHVLKTAAAEGWGEHPVSSTGMPQAAVAEKTPVQPN
jgi:predicted enzyme related to lactoylglutathione lyase